MECPKCKTANSDTAQFCLRCHATLLYKCPACGASQRHGVKCDTCGVDFAKYAFMLVAQEQIRVDREHDQVRERAATWRQIILLPITGGFSLLRYLFSRSKA
jgi:Double zinc ribbon